MKIAKKLTMGLIPILFSCAVDEGYMNLSTNQDINFTGATKSSEEPIIIQGDEMILGEEIQDPYSLDMVKKAYLNVAKTANVSPSENSINATHLYVRFFPKDSIDIETLEAADDIDLYSYPLNRRIIKQGSTTYDELNSRYAAIPIGHPILNSVDHTVLDSLCFPDDISKEEIARLNLTDTLIYKIEKEAISLAEPTNASPASANQDFYPCGQITMYDSLLKRNIPAEGVLVKLRKGTRTHKIYTDENGYFRSNKKFNKYANVTLFWESSKWDIRDDLRGQASTVVGEIPYFAKQYVVSIFDGKDLSFAIIQRAAQRFWFKETYGISRPDYYRKIKIRYTHKTGPGHSGYNNSGDGLGIFTDIRLFKKEHYTEARQKYNTVSMFSTAIHELAHCAQECKLGACKMESINITIRESWAEFVSYYLTLKEYLDLGISLDEYKRPEFVATNSILEEEIIDNNLVYTIPNQYNNQSWTIASTEASKQYTPLFIDLNDDSNQYKYHNENPKYPNDKIKNIPPDILESIAFSSHNKNELINKLKALENRSKYNLTDDNINLYFSYYNYNF